MSETMPALVHAAWGRPPELREVAVPRPARGGVVLRVEAAGMCHSDLHVLDAAPGALPFEPPYVLGHEVAGTVERVGADVDKRWVGRRVVVHGVWGCGTCRRCRAGRENYCLDRGPAIGNGLGHDGGMAELMAVPDTRHLVVADGLDPVTAAPLTDAALTVFHALGPHLGALDAEARVLVIGAGGLGHVAVQLLAATSATLVVVDPKAAARELATTLGAGRVEVDLAAVTRRTSTPADGFDLVVDVVGSSATMTDAMRLVAPGGDALVIGGAGGVVEVGKQLGLAQGWGVRAPFWGSRDDLEAVVELARSGRLETHVERIALTDAVEAYERLRAGHITGRAVVVPDGTKER